MNYGEGIYGLPLITLVLLVMSVQKRSGDILKGLNTSKGAVKYVAPNKTHLTVCVKLILDAEDEQKLAQLHQVYRDACNVLVEDVLQSRLINRVQLHHLSYYKIREAFPTLGSQMACNVIRSVSSAYKTLLSNHPKYRNKDTELKRIEFKNPSVHLDKNTISYLDEDMISLYTLEGRIKAQLDIAQFQAKQLSLGKRRESNLVYHPRKGKRRSYWALHITVEINPETLQTFDPHLDGVMGVDIGENNLAATSNGRIYGGGKLKADRDRYLGYRGRVQRNGSQSAKQALCRASGRERRHVTHVNHEISRQIVNDAKANRIWALVLEDLTHIRDRIKGNRRVKSRLHRWAFRELQEMVIYKATLEGILVIKVDPQYTSQTCSRCGKMGKRSKHRFRCEHCGFQAHSDLNASRNLQGLGYQQITQGLL